MNIIWGIVAIVVVVYLAIFVHSMIHIFCPTGVTADFLLLGCEVVEVVNQ